MSNSIDFDEIVRVLNSQNPEARHKMLSAVKYLAATCIGFLVAGSTHDPDIVARETARDALESLTVMIRERREVLGDE